MNGWQQIQDSVFETLGIRSPSTLLKLTITKKEKLDEAFFDEGFAEKFEARFNSGFKNND